MAVSYNIQDIIETENKEHEGDVGLERQDEDSCTPCPVVFGAPPAQPRCDYHELCE